MRAHFVTFYSPGTLVAETTTKPIDAWDVDKAVEMAASIKERYGATPYGFRFSTRERRDDELDSRQVAQSGMYFLGGKIMSLAELERLNDPHDKILISNMRGNKWGHVVINDNSYRSTQPLCDGDVVIEKGE